MSHDRTDFKAVAADPSFGFAPQPNGGESRTDCKDPTASSRTSGSSLIGDASSSPHPAGEQETSSQINANAAVISTSVESASRDRVRDELEVVVAGSIPLTARPAIQSLEASRAGEEAPTTSYIPPSRPSVPQIVTTQEPTSRGRGSRAMPSSIARPSNMFFGSAHRRRNMANTNALTNYEADMNNKDRAKQKEAVQRFLEENIDDEWNFVWPRPGDQLDFKHVDELGNTGRVAERWKERDEWLSNTNDSDDEPAFPTAASPDTASPTSETFKFESPDDVGEAIRKRELAHKRRRERKLKDELEQNEGLRCFVARRDAWTGARRIKRKSAVPLSNGHDKHAASEAPVPANASTEDLITKDESGYENDSSSDDEVTEIPVAPPLLPPTNPIRASITPAAYKTIYDKVVLQSLSPSCPVNLKDIMHSCVQGWKRDGEWPPKGTAPEPMIAGRRKARKLSVASIFGIGKASEEGEKDAGGNDSGIRKSIQKIFGKKEANGVTVVNGNGNGVVHGNGNGNGPVAAA